MSIPIEVRKEIQPLFNKVLYCSQKQFSTIEEVNTEKVFRDWAINKNRFYEIFGQTCIKNFGEVKMELDKASKEKLVEKFIIWLRRKSRDYSTSEIVNGFNRTANFIERIDIDSFFNNSLKESISVISYDEEFKKIPAGMKVLKVFKFFFNEEHEEYLRMIQDKGSEIIQKATVTGELCFSIHPLDFLSLSENAADWRSCHSLDGEYRAGNLSYMADSSTVIAYVKSKEDKDIGNRFPFKWNNKKWRMLLHFDNYWYAVFAGRPYPFSSPLALEAVRQGLITLFPRVEENNWESGRVTGVNTETYNPKTGEFISTPYVAEGMFEHDRLFNKLVVWQDYIIPIEKLMIGDIEEFCNYNDLCWSSTYFPLHISLTPWSSLCQHGFEVGHKVYCTKCGQQLLTPGVDSMVCEDCYNEYENSYEVPEEDYDESEED